MLAHPRVSARTSVRSTEASLDASGSGSALCSLDAKVRALHLPTTYPQDPGEVRAIETHFAWVFLGKSLAFKLKKPTRLAGMDFRALDARAWACQEEIRVNRRLAPNVYIDAVPLTMDGAGALHVGGVGMVVDWLVQMRRLPSGVMLDQAIATKTVSADRVHALGELLADFYATQQVIMFAPGAYVQRLRDQIDDDRIQLSNAALQLDPARVARVADLQLHSLDILGPVLDARAARGRIVEAHGDLRPEHVCLSDPPCVIDSLEFSAALRILDPLEELAFFSIECELLGAGWVAQTVLDAYAARTADSAAPGVLDFYRSRRASVRAKLVAWHLLDPQVRASADWCARADAYLQRAENYAKTIAG